MRRSAALFVTVLTLLPISLWSLRPLPAGAQSMAIRRSAVGAADLRSLFREEHYSLARVRKTGSVPPIFTSNVPDDLGALSAGDYEHLFIRIVLPAALASNASIESDRARLSELAARSSDDTLETAEAAWLEELAGRYAAPSEDLGDLMARVDVVPASLVLAQAIEESSWGRSPVAVESNVLFARQLGPHASTRSTGTVDSDALLIAFDSIRASVMAHVHDLNTDAAYEKLRGERARLRSAGRRPTGRKLVSTLPSQAEEGRGYVNALTSTLRRQHLSDFDSVSLDSERRPIEVEVEVKVRPVNSAGGETPSEERSSR